MEPFNQLKEATFLNLETFRKNGNGVKTPVWFVQEGEVLYVRTIADSGKVKRIRNNQQVNVAPCKANGDLTGGWAPGKAHEINGDQALMGKVDQLLSKKYGLRKVIFSVMWALQGKQYTLIEIKPGT